MMKVAIPGKARQSPLSRVLWHLPPRLLSNFLICYNIMNLKYTYDILARESSPILTLILKNDPMVPMRIPLSGIPIEEYASSTPRPSCVCGAALPYPIVVMDVNAKNTEL